MRVIPSEYFFCLISFLIAAVVFHQSIQWKAFNLFDLLSVFILSLVIWFLIYDFLDMIAFVLRLFKNLGLFGIRRALPRLVVDLLVAVSLSWISIKRI